MSPLLEAHLLPGDQAAYLRFAGSNGGSNGSPVGRAVLRFLVRTLFLERGSGAHEEAGGLFDVLFDFDEEGDGFFAVYEAVVVAEGEVHHGADDDLVIQGDGALLNGVHAEDAALGGIENGGAEEAAVDAAITNGEDAALEVFDGEFAVAG